MGGGGVDGVRRYEGDGDTLEGDCEFLKGSGGSVHVCNEKCTE